MRNGSLMQRTTLKLLGSSVVGWSSATCGLGFAARFLVGESKSFAYREQRAEGEAVGRPIAVCWFEEKANTAQGCSFDIVVFSSCEARSTSEAWC